MRTTNITVRSRSLRLDEVDREIEFLHRQIAALEARHRWFVLDALIEHAEIEHRAAYEQHQAALRATIRDLFGLNEVVKARHGFRQSLSPNYAIITLPEFWTEQPPVIEVTRNDAFEASMHWRELSAI